MEIVKDFDNKLLNRKEVIAKFDGDGATPARSAVRKDIAKKLKVDEKLIIINKISSHFGGTDVSVKANVYGDAETLNKVTPEHLVKRNAIPEVEEAPVEEAAPAPAAEEATEAPTEEVKEE